MTIDERRAREEYDRLNPWRPMVEAKPDGTVCELLFNDMAGYFPDDAGRYFLTDGGQWHKISPTPGFVFAVPMNWRPAHQRLSIERRKYLLQQGRS